MPFPEYITSYQGGTWTVSVDSAPLPPNAAQESSGNLAALVDRFDQLIVLQTQVVGLLRAVTIQLASVGAPAVSNAELPDLASFN